MQRQLQEAFTLEPMELLALQQQCVLTNNGDAGIALGGSDSGNTFSGNDIANNYCDISLGASGNIIYHNDFKNNQLQVLNVEDTNFWDSGFEGNYWSDYVGSGANHDGIGDSPYIIDPNYRDNYPLMNPYAIREFPSAIPHYSIDDGNTSTFNRYPKARFLTQILQETCVSEKMAD